VSLSDADARLDMQERAKVEYMERKEEDRGMSIHRSKDCCKRYYEVDETERGSSARSVYRAVEARRVWSGRSSFLQLESKRERVFFWVFFITVRQLVTMLVEYENQNVLTVTSKQCSPLCLGLRDLLAN
jgi:hypothetical protein